MLALATLAISCGGKAENTLPRGEPRPRGEPPEPPAATGGAPTDPPPPPAGGSPPTNEPPTPDGCEVDVASGLMWEPLSDEPGTHSYRGATYTWFDSDEERNGGDPGVEDGGDCAYPPCDTRGHVMWTNGFRLCNSSDWRMPTTEELLLLAEQDGRMLTGAEPFYWASETYDDPSAAWGAYLCCGGVAAPSIKAGAGFVRLVRTAE